ncbi:MAG: type III-A CRISPR-associated RAMP protein Csm3 [Cyanobacteria bacterium SID2]|nr:type III-A CRISPR-associated RAMP protein Csm3 [Cyanobacteria bacterium SID2]
MTRTQTPLLGKVRMTSRLVVETGLHIGGGGETLDIGGIDKPVIRDPLTQQPYLPGSSIKGKLRSILERLYNKPLNRPGGSGTYRYESDDLDNGYSEVNGQKIEFEGAKTCPISRLFGSTGNDCWLPASVAKDRGLITEQELSDRRQNNQKIWSNNGTQYTKVKGRNAPARLIVRDCHLDDDSVKKLKKIDTGLYMTEWKFENGLDRVTAAANPRQLERVPAGSWFNFEIVYTIENPAQAEEDLRNIAVALAILEDDALGGHGSRGYGKVRFTDFKMFYRNLSDYRNVKGAVELRSWPQFDSTSALLDDFESIEQQIRSLPETNGDGGQNE